MDVGINLSLDPPVKRLVTLAQQAEAGGFTHVWQWDSHLYWQEPYAIAGLILANTDRVKVGPMVTNPVTRDPSVIASTHATLHEIYGNRTVCGIGRGASAVAGAGVPQASMAEMRDAVRVIRELGNGRPTGYHGRTVALPWATSSKLEVWVSGYGPKTLEFIGKSADGLILQLADPEITAWMIGKVRSAAERAGRDPLSVKVAIAVPTYVGANLDHQTALFYGMVHGHFGSILAAYRDAADGAVPQVLRDYARGASSLRPDEVVERFCLLGPVEAHREKLALYREIGVDHVSAYVQHDATEATIDAYAEEVIPSLGT